MTVSPVPGYCNANTNAITVRVNHSLKMTRRANPILYSLFSNILWVCDAEHSQIISKAMGITIVHSGLTFLLSVVFGVPSGGDVLRGIHQRIVYRQFCHTIFSA